MAAADSVGRLATYEVGRSSTSAPLRAPVLTSSE